jgi:hypothetical protein
LTPGCRTRALPAFPPRPGKGEVCASGPACPLCANPVAARPLAASR